MNTKTRRSGIHRVLVANRGEIAVRILRNCRSRNRETVLVASQADLDSLPARLADRVLCVGSPRSSDSYLRAEVIAHAASATGCDAVHPGIGFLSEDPGFAAACAEANVVFIGPSPNVLRLFGDKLQARAAARSAGLPILAGMEVHSANDAGKVLAQTGLPAILKASAGGGGKGIRLVESLEQLFAVFDNAAAEAKAAFGDGRLQLETYLAHARHIEVQVAVDRFGNGIHLGERDCSLQYRYQKVLEEAQAPGLDDDLRERICNAAVQLLVSHGYVGVGTVEFLLDADGDRFFFLEVNPRLQVEHPITEMVTGVDLVDLQFAIAEGAALPLRQEEVSWNGHAIEARINAQDPAHDLRPTPGRLSSWQPPEQSASLRLDTHCFEGYLVPPYYDSLLAKLIVHGRDRADALSRLADSLGDFRIDGVPTNLPLLVDLLKTSEVRDGRITTRWLSEYMERSAPVSSV